MLSVTLTFEAISVMQNEHSGRHELWWWQYRWKRLVLQSCNIPFSANCNTTSRKATSCMSRLGWRKFRRISFCSYTSINLTSSSFDHSMLTSDVTARVIHYTITSTITIIFRNLSSKLLQVSTYLCVTQYLHNAKIIGLHFHAVCITNLNNNPSSKISKLGPCLIYLLHTNLTASCIFMSIHVRRPCTINVYTITHVHCTLYGVHVHRTCVIV